MEWLVKQNCNRRAAAVYDFFITAIKTQQPFNDCCVSKVQKYLMWD